MNTAQSICICFCLLVQQSLQRVRIALFRWAIIALPCLLIVSLAGQVRANDTELFKQILRRANGRTAVLEPKRVYVVSEKMQLNTLCPLGVSIVGNGATLKASTSFQQTVLLTATNLLRDAAFMSPVSIQNLTVDGSEQVGRAVFGHWGNARIDGLTVLGGTDYQVNAIWRNSVLTNLTLQGSPTQTNNGFDCSMHDSVIYNTNVDMNGNLTESAFWLNGCRNALVVGLHANDGRTAFGMENCQDVNIVGIKATGRYSFRRVNILRAAPSERIHLYDIDLDTTHVGTDPSTGIHFNETRSGLVVRAKLDSDDGVAMSNTPRDIDVVDTNVQSNQLSPRDSWRSFVPGQWNSLHRESRGVVKNRAPVVWLGPDRASPFRSSLRLSAIVADELPTDELQLRWSKVSGPGDVAFGNTASKTTRVSFSMPGMYTLRMDVQDGEQTSSDTVVLTVGNNQPAPAIQKTRKRIRENNR